MDRIARRVLEMLEEVRPGTIVAVWADASVSAHRSLGFRCRTLPNGMREEPLTSFVKELERSALGSIEGRLRQAAELTTTPIVP